MNLFISQKTFESQVDVIHLMWDNNVNNIADAVSSAMLRHSIDVQNEVDKVYVDISKKTSFLNKLINNIKKIIK